MASVTCLGRGSRFPDGLCARVAGLPSQGSEDSPPCRAPPSLEPPPQNRYDNPASSCWVSMAVSTLTRVVLGMPRSQVMLLSS